MSTITLSKESHNDPSKFRASYENERIALGLTAGKPTNSSLPTIHSSSKIAIIGAGFGGIGAAIKTIKEFKETDFVIFEKHDNFGGTWWANTYPGCASDIPAIWYSFSYALTTNWSRVQPPQYEMEEYLLRIVDEHKLREKARLKTSVDKCEYNESTGLWTLYSHDLGTGQKIEHTCKVIVSCRGGLVHPRDLEAPGLENFGGKYMHSAVWDHSIDFKGKDVVVVGNGCSAVQIVPTLLDDPQYNVGSLTQVFRSKHYIMPPVPPFLLKLYHLVSFNFYGMMFVRSSLTERSVNYIHSTAPKKYWDMLIPSFKVGCKRMILDYRYVPTLSNQRLELAYSGIKEVVKDGVVLDDGRFVKADIIVACTGYDLSRSAQMPVTTTTGISVSDLWQKEGTSAYRTILVKDVPNLFVIGGPNSGTGHSSVIMTLENAVDYYVKVAKPVIKGQKKSVVVKSQAYDNWRVTIQNELKKSVFGTKFGGCVSWYSNEKENPTAFAWSQVYFWYMTHFPNYRDLIYENYKKKID
ncbi:hypothetical protein CANMA_005321 [Candida margitis]|uniref:uncharacterized protein n=1 Tax=Candida margitis TaxID=1775924 RepID=UPI002226607C|nr:uncharacterized protein CANMA_005321 [Candida margitis]KAI5950393.1 hypothetical protein CANMA_005321 [Candida margitis]